MFLKKVFFIIYYWGQTSLKMDSAEIVFAEVQQVIGKTGKYSNLWHLPKYGINCSLWISFKKYLVFAAIDF